MYIDLHVKYLVFISDFSESRVSSTEVSKILYNDFYEKKDVMKLRVVIRNFANAPENHAVYWAWPDNKS
jgi:hypothetical protein